MDVISIQIICTTTKKNNGSEAVTKRTHCLAGRSTKLSADSKSKELSAEVDKGINETLEYSKAP